MASEEHGGRDSASPGQARGQGVPEAPGGKRAARSGGPSLRGLLSWILVLLAALGSLLGVYAVWIRAVTLNTDTFTGIVAPLIGDERVAEAVSDEAIDVLFSQADVARAIRHLLPEGWDFASEPITGVLEELSRRATREILQTEQFQFVWRNALRIAHASAVRLVRNEEAFRVTGRGEVVLDLGELLESIRAGLVDRGVTALEEVAFPDDAGEVVVYRADELRAARRAVRTLDTLNWALPLAALVLFAAGVAVARDRRRALLVSASSLTVAMALALVMLNVAQGYVLGRIADPPAHAAANVIWNNLWNGFVALTVALLVLGVLVAVGAVLAGPYPPMVRLRSRFFGFFSRRAPGAEG